MLPTRSVETHPLISACDDLEAYVPQQLKAKIWAGEYTELPQTAHELCEQARSLALTSKEGEPILMRYKSQMKKLENFEAYGPREAVDAPNLKSLKMSHDYVAVVEIANRQSSKSCLAPKFE